MAEELKSKEKEKTNVKKKIATGSTHKVVQSRKSSVAGKSVSKKGTTNKEKKSSASIKMMDNETKDATFGRHKAEELNEIEENIINEEVEEVIEEKPKRTRKKKEEDTSTEIEKPRRARRAKEEEDISEIKESKKARRAKEDNDETEQPKRTRKAKSEETFSEIEKPKRTKKVKGVEDFSENEEIAEDEKAKMILDELMASISKGEPKKVIKEQIRKYLPNGGFNPNEEEKSSKDFAKERLSREFSREERKATRTSLKLEEEEEPEIEEEIEEVEIEEPKVTKTARTSTRSKGKHATSSRESRRLARNSRYSDDEEEEIEEQEEKIDLALQRKQEKAVKEAVAKELKANKKIPTTEHNKMNTRIFQNICMAVGFMLYLNFVILGFINIESSVFITDLKVFSIAILIIALGTFEYAYKKESGRHVIHGLELLVLAFLTMLFIYANLMWKDQFIYLAASSIYVFAIYYVAKAIIVYRRLRKRYFVERMKEMIKK